MEDNKLLDKIEKKIIQILKKEGGAAGLAPLKKATDKMDQPKDFDLKKTLKKMDKVEKHKESDYILTPINENTPTSISDKDLDDLGNIISKYVEDPDDVQRELDRFDDGGFDNMSNMVTANLLRDPEYKKWYNNLHSIKETDAVKLSKRNMTMYGKKAKMKESELREMIRETIFETMNEGLCAKGKAYIAKRKRAGEKSSAYLSGRAVKVCKGQMKG
tara:strand:- start:326 stop:976 length:651 start_codon:yes stop_codon:yes gene_type:complete